MPRQSTDDRLEGTTPSSKFQRQLAKFQRHFGAKSGFLASEIQGVQELVCIQEILALVLTPLAKQPLHRSESTD